MCDVSLRNHNNNPNQKNKNSDIVVHSKLALRLMNSEIQGFWHIEQLIQNYHWELLFNTIEYYVIDIKNHPSLVNTTDALKN